MYYYHTMSPLKHQTIQNDLLLFIVKQTIISQNTDFREPPPPPEPFKLAHKISLLSHPPIKSSTLHKNIVMIDFLIYHGEINLKKICIQKLKRII